MNIKTIATNRKALHNYSILEAMEAGIALTGSEIKSIRSGRVSLGEAYVRLEGGELWLINAHIARYEAASHESHEPTRRRKLLVIADRRKFGNICVRAYKEAGWEVYPVNPQQTTIEELVVYPKLSQVPVELDRISVYLPPPTTRRLLGEIADKGADDVFFNPGSADAAVLEEARDAGIKVRNGCSITYIGKSPAQFM